MKNSKEKDGGSIYINQGLYMKGDGSMANNMDMESTTLQMEIYMKESTRITREMEKEHTFS